MTTVALHSPVTVTGPIFAERPLAYMGAAATGTALLGAGIALVAGGGTKGALISGAIGAWFGFGLGGMQDAMPFPSDKPGILDKVAEAKAEARESASGDKFRKAGIALSAGYKTAFQESYQRGHNLVDGAIETVGGVGSFVDGLLSS